MSTRAAAVVLPQPGAEKDAGTMAVVTGWGVTRVKNNFLPMQLTMETHQLLK